MTYWISWTLRCAQYGFSGPVHDYGKKLLSYFIYGSDISGNYQYNDGDENASFTKVTTWREKNKVDLWVEAITDSDKKYALICELKCYSSMGNHQLQEHIDAAKNAYIDQDVKIRYLFITLHEKHRANYYNQCIEKGFYFIDNFPPLGKEKGNSLFDEFWFKSAGYL